MKYPGIVKYKKRIINGSHMSINRFLSSEGQAANHFPLLLLYFLSSLDRMQTIWPFSLHIYVLILKKNLFCLHDLVSLFQISLVSSDILIKIMCSMREMLSHYLQQSIWYDTWLSQCHVYFQDKQPFLCPVTARWCKSFHMYWNSYNNKTLYFLL